MSEYSILVCVESSGSKYETQYFDTDEEAQIYLDGIPLPVWAEREDVSGAMVIVNKST